MRIDVWGSALLHTSHERPHTMNVNDDREVSAGTFGPTLQRSRFSWRVETHCNVQSGSCHCSRFYARGTEGPVWSSRFLATCVSVTQRESALQLIFESLHWLQCCCVCGLFVRTWIRRMQQWWDVMRMLSLWCLDLTRDWWHSMTTMMMEVITVPRLRSWCWELSEMMDSVSAYRWPAAWERQASKTAMRYINQSINQSVGLIFYIALATNCGFVTDGPSRARLNHKCDFLYICINRTKNKQQIHAANRKQTNINKKNIPT